VTPRRGFASDNWAPAHPQALEALARANAAGHLPAYGDEGDPFVAGAKRRFRELLGEHVEPFFVFNGTGANVLGLAALVKPHEAVLCAETAHVFVDECGAFERFAGSRLLTVRTRHGKLRPADLEPLLARRGDQHAAQPRVVSITNSTELGTVYAPGEVRALAAWCREHDLLLHCDGARIANAAAAHGGDVRALLDGVDVLSFGGTKNGLVFGEAVVFLRPELARDFAFTRKQGMQLASKMRYVAAQLDALLADGLWLASARHANRMAELLAREAARVPGVKLAREREANAVFALLPRERVPRVQAEWPFYVWDARPGEAAAEVRWVCSWDTTEDDVRGLVESLRRHVQ
jgi:threonine aldolase